jgi:hypothetical protein
MPAPSHPLAAGMSARDVLAAPVAFGFMHLRVLWIIPEHPESARIRCPRKKQLWGTVVNPADFVLKLCAFWQSSALRKQHR